MIIRAAVGDCFLLSVDGLHDLVSFQTIKKKLAACDSPKKSAELVLGAALQNSGKDNVTAIVVHLQ
jgi:serine/threonine protein phosphatase PrpC